MFTLFLTISLVFRYRFDEKESISSVQQLKSSVQKGIRTKLLECYPLLEGYVDLILPKKENFRIIKWYKTLSYIHRFRYSTVNQFFDL